MSRGQQRWRGRRKRTIRRIGHDLRLIAPMIALAACFAVSAGVIATAQHAPDLLIHGVARATQGLDLPSVGAPPPSSREAGEERVLEAGSRERRVGCPAP
jgi:hypothetical protein